EKAARDMKPHSVAAYLHELASMFNEYYHAEKVIGSPEEKARLALVSAFAQVMRNGLSLLGITPLEAM
ncbi:MAG: arginine--tRNA ligase, partial [Candidatus Aenigmarchaeota archaeon]|nr:arginine--tRNA ligase [Candidatus Aenigmarchaeota archaeon]